jgi:hypothetical protein
VNHAVKLNRMIIRDANLLPAVDSFSEEFADCAIISLINFFFDYDQIEFDVKSRDITAFMIPIGFFRQTTFSQGAINSIAQFVRIVIKILQKHIPHICLPFMDDIGVKGPRIIYNNEEAAPGTRRYMLEHIIWLDGVLADLKRAGCTILGPKSQFCMPGIRIVSFVCDYLGKHPDSAKVIKIVK